MNHSDWKIVVFKAFSRIFGNVKEIRVSEFAQKTDLFLRDSLGVRGGAFFNPVFSSLINQREPYDGLPT